LRQRNVSNSVKEKSNKKGKRVLANRKVLAFALKNTKYQVSRPIKKKNKKKLFKKREGRKLKQRNKKYKKF
jgi:hypothetical protein